MRKSRQLGKESFYVGEGSVSMGMAKKTAYPPGKSPGMKAYLDQWGPMPTDTRGTVSKGTKRVDRSGVLDLYDE